MEKTSQTAAWPLVGGLGSIVIGMGENGIVLVQLSGDVIFNSDQMFSYTRAVRQVYVWKNMIMG